MLSSSPSIGPLLVYQFGYEHARRDPTPPLSSWLPWAARREVCAAQEHVMLRSAQCLLGQRRGIEPVVLAAIQRQAHQVASSSVLGSSSVPAGVDQGAADGTYRLRTSLSPGPTALRPPARLPVHMAERRRLPYPGRRVGRPQRRRPAADLCQVRRGPGRARQAPHQRSPRPGLTWARIGHSDLHFSTPDRTQPHTRDRSRPRDPGITAGHQPRTKAFTQWGGWGSNPRPADYESAALTG